MSTAQKVDHHTFSSGFYFIPLGGSEEFGINFNLYACDGKWVIFDCGIGFADHRFPGIDILLPDPDFIENYQQDLLGLVITHAHEDHVGAVPYLWPRLKCPIYCTPFTAAVLRAKLNEYPNCKNVPIIEIDPDVPVDLAPFHLDFIHMAHSIPQAVSTVIETPYGRVLHSGDWNLDPTPVIDEPADISKLKAAGEKGILAYVGDSTNSPSPGRAGTEQEVISGLEHVFAQAEGRILVTIFASNIGRVQSICQAAHKVGRSVCLLGRSLHRMVSNAVACGYLKDIPDFIPEEDLPLIPASNILMIVTGSQGETQAALARIARGDWREIKLGKGDMAVFSSKAIPGNEKDINAVKNHLSASKVRVVDTHNAGVRIHVSGHPYADEVKDMLGWIRPQVVIPVHGERMMLEAQANIAHSLGIMNTIIPSNGSVIRLAPGLPEVIDHVPAGALAVEPQRIVSSAHKAISERRKLQYSGAAHITVVIDKALRLKSPPQITLIGLIDHDDEGEMDVVGDVEVEIESTVAEAREDGITDPMRIEEDIRVNCRRLLNQVFGFKPKVSVHMVIV
ncbi:MAG: ribonuclease J [Pseudobdellovibrionaceae bacterium]